MYVLPSSGVYPPSFQSRGAEASLALLLIPTLLASRSMWRLLVLVTWSVGLDIICYHCQLHGCPDAKWISRLWSFYNIIAFATTLANGEQPGKFHFQQNQMWKHLMNCLEVQFLSLKFYKKEEQEWNCLLFCMCTVLVVCLSRRAWSWYSAPNVRSGSMLALVWTSPTEHLK